MKNFKFKFCNFGSRSKSLSCPRGQEGYDLVVTWVNVSDPVWQSAAQASGCKVKDYLIGNGDVDVFQVISIFVC